jgi:hypothetical protein
MFDQPIVERRGTSPLATSLLVLSAVFLLAAIVIVGVQIKAQTYGTETPTQSAAAWNSRNQKNVIAEIEGILASDQKP